MKKSILSIALLLSLVFALMGCGGGMPSDIDKDTYEYGKEVLMVLEEYRDNKMSDTEAKDRLAELDEKVAAVKPKEEYQSKNDSLITIIALARTQILVGESVIDQINDTKELLGMEEE